MRSKINTLHFFLQSHAVIPAMGEHAHGQGTSLRLALRQQALVRIASGQAGRLEFPVVVELQRFEEFSFIRRSFTSACIC